MIVKGKALTLVGANNSLYLAGATLLLFVIPVVQPPTLVLQVAFLVFAYAALAQSWNVFAGYSGYTNISHSAFLGVGGYTVAVLYRQFGWIPFVTFPVGGLMAAILALVIGAICLRVRGHYFLVATLLVMFIIQSLALNLKSLTNGASGIDLPLFTRDVALETLVWYYVGLALMVSTALIAVFIERSRFGLNLMAIREDEDVASSMGVRTSSTKALGFAISAFCCGVVGAMYVYRAHIVEPFGLFAFGTAVAPILMAILGGTRTWLGPIIGAFVLQIVATLLVYLIGTEINALVLAVFLIVIVLVMPEGLLGFARRPGRFVRGFPSEETARPRGVVDGHRGG